MILFFLFENFVRIPEISSQIDKNPQGPICSSSLMPSKLPRRFDRSNSVSLMKETSFFVLFSGYIINSCLFQAGVCFLNTARDLSLKPEKVDLLLVC